MEEETHKALQAYSELTGIPITTVIGRAVKHYMDTVGKVHMDVMQGKAGLPLAAAPVEESFHGSAMVDGPS